MTEESTHEPSKLHAHSKVPSETTTDSRISSAGTSSEGPDDATTPFRIAVCALSDVGRVRTNNEDAFGYDETLGIYVVCDGMGGMASGEVASAHTVAAIVSSFIETSASAVPISTRLLIAITAANIDVWEHGQI